MLIVQNVIVSEATESVPEDASSFYISVPAMFLSRPYELADGDVISGRITRVVKDQEIPPLRDQGILFILQKSEIYDRLYILKSDWIKLFREWGLVTPGYAIGVVLYDATKGQTGETVKLYTARDFKY